MPIIKPVAMHAGDGWLEGMSSVAQKMVMAVSGALMVAFLVAHVAGNLTIFSGAQAFNAYAAWLHSFEELLWVQRAGLLAAVGLHIWAATALTLRAGRARYAHRRPVRGGYAARTMRWGGVIIALFVVYHLLDLTTRHLNPVPDRADAYGAVVQGFARWYVAAFYTLAVSVLGLHLRHGIWSAFQTLGLRFARPVALAVAVLICAGFLAVPLAVVIGVVT